MTDTSINAGEFEIKAKYEPELDKRREDRINDVLQRQLADCAQAASTD